MLSATYFHQLFPQLFPFWLTIPEQNFNERGDLIIEISPPGHAMRKHMKTAVATLLLTANVNIQFHHTNNDSAMAVSGNLRELNSWLMSLSKSSLHNLRINFEQTLVSKFLKRSRLLCAQMLTSLQPPPIQDIPNHPASNHIPGKFFIAALKNAIAICQQLKTLHNTASIAHNALHSHIILTKLCAIKKDVAVIATACSHPARTNKKSIKQLISNLTTIMDQLTMVSHQLTNKFSNLLLPIAAQNSASSNVAASSQTTIRKRLTVNKPLTQASHASAAAPAGSSQRPASAMAMAPQNQAGNLAPEPARPASLASINFNFN